MASAMSLLRAASSCALFLSLQACSGDSSMTAADGTGVPSEQRESEPSSSAPATPPPATGGAIPAASGADTSGDGQIGSIAPSALPGGAGASTPDPPAPAPAGGGTSDPPSAHGELLAFPGAQGFGRLAVGARGLDVYHVTNLNDAGPGSLRDAISQPGRTVVFEVGGVIRLASRLVFRNNQTIAGQTAPGGGITIYGDGTSFSAASNTIVRYVRFRMGRAGEPEKDTVTMANGHDVIWDHCSLSWGRDGTFDLNQESGEQLYNLTLQDSIVAQGLQTHSTGGLVNTTGTSIIRSLYIDNNSRNPKARGTLQFVNNVVYDWVVSGYILGDTSGRSDGYMAGNYLITGPETRGGTLDSPTPSYQLFASGNFYDSNQDGVLDGRLLAQGDFGDVTWLAAPSVPFPDVPVLEASEAYRHVFDNAGASLFRDAADLYVLDELASVGTRGSTIDDEAVLGFADGVGELPSAAAPADLDRDGMADAWELEGGLDPSDPEDRNADRNGDGWTNLEEYVNSLAR
jgi:pectate lyase